MGRSVINVVHFVRDLLVYAAFRFVWFLLSSLPYRIRITVLSAISRFVLALPRYQRIAARNLSLAFPERTEEEREGIARGSAASLGLLLADLMRIPRVDRAWVEQHVDLPFLSRYQELKRQRPRPGLIIATGHLGSFELFAQTIALHGFPISYIVRSMKSPRIDAFINAIREFHGNRVIARRGAVRELLQQLGDGRDIGILFDQNVTHKHAVYVPWFGRLAATTRTLGVAALRERAIVLVTAMITTGYDTYKIVVTERNFDELYQDSTLSDEEKIDRITRTVTADFEALIRLHPEQWFWMHKRWRTTPPGESSFY